MRIVFVFSALCLFIPAASAQVYWDGNPRVHSDQETTADADETYDDGIDFIPPIKKLVQEKNGIKYATGGVGDEEAAALKAVSGQFNLHILSTALNGEYISYYTITVKQGDKTLFEGKGDGPRFLLQLAPGEYTVESSYNSKDAAPQKTHLPEKGRREVRFRW